MILDFNKPEPTPCHRFPFGPGFILCLRVVNNHAACAWVEDKDTNIIPIESVIDVLERPEFIGIKNTHYLLEREKTYMFYFQQKLLLKIHPCRIESDIELCLT